MDIAELVERFIEDTDLIPEIFADRVCAELRELLGQGVSKPVEAYLQSPDLQGYLVEKTAKVYAADNSFRVRMREMHDPREQYAAFVRHWASAELVRQYPSVRSLIPQRYAVGEAPKLPVVGRPSTVVHRASASRSALSPGA